MKYLLDTDICIFLIKNKHTTLLKKIQKIPFGEIGLSSITIAELCYGVEKSHQKSTNRVALTQFITPFAFIDFDASAAIEYGRIRTDLERQGKIIGPNDLLIAAQAVRHNMTLVTNNTKEFKRVKRLSLENWLH